MSRNLLNTLGEDAKVTAKKTIRPDEAEVKDGTGGRKETESLRPIVETHNCPHDITLLEVSFWTGWVSVMPSDAGIRDCNVYRQPLELVAIFKSEHADR